MTEPLDVGSGVTIPPEEITLRFSPSGGPGGQHANRSSTRVELTWNVKSSAALDPRQRRRVMGRLRHRIDDSGNLRVRSDAYRSQTRNRKDALDRLASLVADALRPPKKRLPTRPTKASEERRLQSKRRHSEKKRLRRTEQ